jgi:hypothetical protein
METKSGQNQIELFPFTWRFMTSIKNKFL